MLKYDDFMKLALNEAKKCSRKKEIPVGAIIVDEFKNIISKGYNKSGIFFELNCTFPFGYFNKYSTFFSFTKLCRGVINTPKVFIAR